MAAPAARRLSIFASATVPAPTTRTGRRSRRRKMGSRLMVVTSTRQLDRNATGRKIALHGSEVFTGQRCAQFSVGMAREISAQILSRFAFGQVFAQQPLDGIGNQRCGRAEADGPRGGGVFADGAANEKVVRVRQLAVVFDLLAFEADVGDPMLAAAVRASSHVQAQLLIEV